MEKNKPVSLLYDFASIIVTGIVAIAIIFTFFFRTADVSGSSMVPTLNDKDVLMITAHQKEVKYGDIVIITQPNAFNEPLVKRVIATAGQTIDIDFDEGVVYVDGQALEEDYIAEETHRQEDFEGPVTVPEGHVFVMGDNRNNSSDSRSALVGFIDTRYIYGKVIGRIFPYGSWDVYK
ncbi:MAG: signal peptidase I [Clostridia bacterium]|nr:signal peptidase I [Clostridia bacterium]